MVATREVFQGLSTTLLCTVSSSAPFKVQWTKNRSVLGPVSTRIGKVNLTHVIAGASLRHQGDYTCYASNVGGSASATTTLTVKGEMNVCME